jgi:hypothetical protein
LLGGMSGIYWWALKGAEQQRNLLVGGKRREIGSNDSERKTKRQIKVVSLGLSS